MAISLFVLIESYFIFRKQVVTLYIHDDEFFRIFQFLKKHSCSSSISSDVKITKEYEVSNVNGLKKFTLKITIKGKRFSVNMLDGFDEQDLISFYEFLESPPGKNE